MTEDETLLSHVHPAGWNNPRPAGMYDLVVVGGGTAGLVCATGTAGLGARVALVEWALLGGDCLHTGCVPSKALLRSARVVRDVHAGADVGVRADPVVDFRAVMTHVRTSRLSLAPHDSAARFTSLGVDVFFGDGSFADDRTVVVHAAGHATALPNDPVVLRFRRAVIATGSRPAVPAVAGLEAVPYLTSDTLFSMTAQPRSLAIVGAGPIGCEMAQAFALLGTKVTMVDTAPRVLAHEDPDASAIVARHLERAGVSLAIGGSITAVTRTPSGVAVTLPSRTIDAEAILVATGRTPQVDGLNLEAAGVAVTPATVVVDDCLRTTNRRIFAAGDVCSPYRFTHAADAMARIVIQNALFYGRKRASALVIPWCTYTFPEVAHVGVPTGTAADEGGDTITVGLGDVDRSVVDAETDGFVRIRHARGKVLGATIVAPHAGELIAHLAHLMRTGGTLGDLSAAIVPYPTVFDALRKAGDAYRRTSLTPVVRAILRRYFALLRR